MTEEEFKKVQQLHYGWYVQAVSALLGAMGKELYMKMDRNNRRAFVACLDNIEKEHDLQSGAKCLVKAFDNQLVKSYPYALHRSYYDFVDESIKRPAVVKKKTLVRKIIKNLVRANAATLLKLNFSNKQQKMLRRSFMKKVKQPMELKTNGHEDASAIFGGLFYEHMLQSTIPLKYCVVASQRANEEEPKLAELHELPCSLRLL
ncbi:hypothetical protein GCK32_005259 [Trichostrongylus colubriformis]|uniref:Uncharacterized protein n=1 Tax=Trichostrongylus colubriformis TaxID=6319 RepID=A0AAN8FC11_TRICO